MRATRFAALHFLPSACRREQGESAPDAATGSTLFGVALLRQPQVCRGAGTGVATAHQPKTRATADAADGHRSLVPEAEPESPGSRARDLSVSTPRCRRQSAQPGLEHRYYLPSAGLSVSGGHYGLVQSLRVELGSVQHLRGGFLSFHIGGRIARRQLRDLQLRPRLAVYLQPVSAAAQGPLYPNQHGWAWASSGQCVYRAAVALDKIRTDLPRRLRFWRRTLVGVALLFRPLQFPPPASGTGLLHASRTVSEPATQEQNKVSRCAAVFAFTAHGLARELHQNNAFKQKALQLSQRAYQQPIASEPVRRFGRGHAPGATPMRSPSLADGAAVCDPGFAPRRSSLDRTKFCPTIGVHLK